MRLRGLLAPYLGCRLQGTDREPRTGLAELDAAILTSDISKTDLRCSVLTGNTLVD